jgi:DNA-directed RNA polymerase beta' subunit
MLTFDEDKINISVLQSEWVRVEVAHLMAVQMHVIFAQNQKLIMSLIQDGIIGAMLLTHRDIFFTIA